MFADSFEVLCKPRGKNWQNEGFQVGFMQTAQALKFNIALVRSTMRSRYTIHGIVKYKIDLHSTNTQINKQYLQRIEYLYFISKIMIFGRAKDFVARSKRFSIEYNYCYENHQTM